MAFVEGRPSPTNTAAAADRADRLAEWLIGGGLTASLGVTYLLLMAAWVPQYLAWPWWIDLDHFGTFAMAWDAGVLPYRDLPSFQFPGEYYLFWAVGKVFGWGKTAPIYAVDASLLATFGVASAVWSRRRFGRTLPGVAGYALFLCYYMGLGLSEVAQRDWHAGLPAVLGLLAAEAFPGRAGRVASALAFASAFTIRPHAVLLGPAYILALDESARQPGGPWSLTRRATVEWAAIVFAGVALGFAPLAAAGLLDDFVRGVGEAAPGGAYNKLTPSSLVARLVEQFDGQTRVLTLAAALAVLTTRWVPGMRRPALTWLTAFAGAWFFKPLSPIAHAYLIHPLMLVSSVVAALLVETVLEVPRWSTSFRLAVVSFVLLLEVPGTPRFVSISRSVHALTEEDGFEFPRQTPSCGGVQAYKWSDYRETILYLRRTLPPGVRVANALRGLPSVTAPIARLPAFPTESLGMFPYFKGRPGLVESYVKSLRDTPNSVVVWAPFEMKQSDNYVPPPILSFIATRYTPEARFGVIEVWRPLPPDERPRPSDGEGRSHPAQ